MCLAATAGCGGASDRPQPGPLNVSKDERLLAERQAGGRVWRVYNDCANASNSTWTSQDAGRTWLMSDGPGGVNCTVGSGVKLLNVTADEAVAEVSQGPQPTITNYRSTDGGLTWRSAP